MGRLDWIFLAIVMVPGCYRDDSSELKERNLSEQKNPDVWQGALDDARQALKSTPNTIGTVRNLDQKAQSVLTRVEALLTSDSKHVTSCFETTEPCWKSTAKLITTPLSDSPLISCSKLESDLSKATLAWQNFEVHSRDLSRISYELEAEPDRLSELQIELFKITSKLNQDLDQIESVFPRNLAIPDRIIEYRWDFSPISISAPLNQAQSRIAGVINTQPPLNGLSELQIKFVHMPEAELHDSNIASLKDFPKIIDGFKIIDDHTIVLKRLSTPTEACFDGWSIHAFGSVKIPDTTLSQANEAPQKSEVNIELFGKLRTLKEEGVIRCLGLNHCLDPRANPESDNSNKSHQQSVQSQQKSETQQKVQTQQKLQRQ